MKVLIIDNNDSFTFNLAQIIGQSGLCDCTILTYGKMDLEYIDIFHKILISPGPGLPKDYPQLYKVINIYAGTKSILGVCLGHQIIGEYYGARLINLNNVFHGVSKRIKILDPDEYIYQDILEDIDVGLYHSWAISDSDFPADLSITARDSSDLIMSVAHKEMDVRGVQFHPESIMTRYGSQMILNWLMH